MSQSTPDGRTLLLLDSNSAHADVFQKALREAYDGPFKGVWVKSLAEGILRLQEEDIWAIFLNLTLPDSQGLETFDRLLLAAPGVPTLVIAGVEEQNVALNALRHGAKDFLLEDHLDTYSFGRAIRHMVERETAAEALFTEKERAQVTLDSIGDAVLCTDLEGKISYLNVVAETMTGWTQKKALGQPLTTVFKIIDRYTRKPCLDPLKRAVQENRTVGLSADCVLIRPDGREIIIEDSAAPIHDRSGSVTGGVIVFRDVRMSEAMTLEMSYLAQHDILTNLPNRMLLKDRLTQAIAACRRNRTRAAVLFLDLDGFKHINDSLGHAIGDKILQSVAKRLPGCVRHSDTVSRQGGDEFIVLLSEIQQARDASLTARKILDALIVPHDIEQYSLRVTASIGVTTYPDDGQEADTLIKNADMAMYQAKEEGRNKY